jgi:hypothetical protein
MDYGSSGISICAKQNDMIFLHFFLEYEYDDKHNTTSLLSLFLGCPASFITQWPIFKGPPHTL